MLFDCFLFFNEFELLDIRFGEYQEYIDYFVIGIGRLTFSRQLNPYYEEYDRIYTLARKHGIGRDRVILVDADFEDLYSSVTNTNQDVNWVVEKYRRIAMWYHIRPRMDIDDFALLGDVDEFMPIYILDDLKSNETIKQRLTTMPGLIWLQNHYYYFNCREKTSGCTWPGQVVLSKEQMQLNSFQTFRELRETNPNMFIQWGGGNHYSYLGGVDNIRQKIQSFSHQEYNTPNYTNEQNLCECITNAKDLFGRNNMVFEFIQPSEMKDAPKYLLDNLEQFKEFIYEN